jgi:hypothetical protein
VSTDLEVIESNLQSIDLNRIAGFTRKLSDIGQGFNKMMAPVYLREFIIAYDVSSVMHAKAVQAELNAKSAVDTAEAIAYLDRAPDFFKKRDEKPTVESRKAYVALDPDVQRAKDVYARAQAMALLMRNKVQEFRFAIDAVRKLSEDGYMTPWEGMK